MAYPEYDLNEPSLGQTFADLLRGVKNPKSWQEVGQGIQNVAKITPSVGESLGRGALVQLPAFAGDVSQTARQIAPETMQNTFGNRYMPTSEEILAKVPRMTPDYQGSQSHEMMGGIISPAMPFLLRAGAQATKGLPLGNMIAYHGTPHEIKGAFDISKVGTGEGVQSYGHGIYFAEEPKVAQEYQKRLSGRTDLRESPSDSAYVHAVQSFRDANYPLEQIPAEMKKAYKSITDKDIKLAIQASDKGNFYKVDIPDKDIPNMLDWDKPLLQQTPQVQEALAKLGIKSDKQKLSQFDDALLNALMNDGKTALPKQPINPTGQDIYQKFIQGNPQLTSQKLNEAGIRGIRYLDEGSRNLTNGEIINTFKTPEGWKTKVRVTGTNGTDANGKPISSFTTSMPFKTAKEAEDWAKTKISSGTSNFVVFDPKEVKILEKNSKPVTRKEILEKQIKKIE
jgi:hypothetical protein